MPLPQPVLLAIAAMISLAMLRLIRVHFGREPHPDGKARLPFILAFLIAPPVVLGTLVESGTGQVGGISWLPLYVVSVVVLGVLMWIASMIVRVITPRRFRPLLLMALSAGEDKPGVAIDPPLTARLAESQGLVDTANAVFPGGVDFPTQVDRAGFRQGWDALDAATRTLESRIAEDEALGKGVASAVIATAENARGRLETLRGLAADGGQAWATA
ncbi:MAG TPA: hypothetical protein VGQ02_01570 [Candidatus Limnocylindrales bacterium]|jgi:hypothetical protein|nr:hypothetical protein [Candidatus Limnocylindrales bacterium]